jgi:hypothetical protein
MSKKPPHIKWLIDTGERLNSADGKEIEVWEFKYQNDNLILSEWATHFRNHYCLDSQIDKLISGTRRSKKQYLIDIKFPDEKNKPGPSLRAGDFAEILVADYLEFICNYWVPRSRYIDKVIRNESKKGSDIIGFKIMQLETYSSADEMIIFEVKAALTETKKNKLQEAIVSSNEDECRIAESLNALKQKFIDSEETVKMKKVERFQNKIDYPYIEKSGAAAVLEKSVFNKTVFSATITSKHYNQDYLSLIVVKGENMMPLVHELYRRAANEA